MALRGALPPLKVGRAHSRAEPVAAQWGVEVWREHGGAGTQRPGARVRGAGSSNQEATSGPGIKRPHTCMDSLV